MVSKSTKATLSWCLDATSTIVVCVLLFAWISDINSENDDENQLSKSFIANGFCLSPWFDNTRFNTHTACATFDALCACVVIIAIQTKMVSSPAALGMAAYFFAHSYGHYEAGTNGIDGKDDLSLHDSIVLAAILSIGPMAMAKNLVEAKKLAQGKANVLAGILLSILVVVYKLYIRRANRALLYINVSIILTQHAPHVLMVGFQSKEDVELRSSKFHWPAYFSRIFVMWILFCEPFYCDEFVASIGGHFVFDLSLALDVLAELMRPSDGEGREAKKLKST